eukprot:1149530-Rhodomonas_salina.3
MEALVSFMEALMPVVEALMSLVEHPLKGRRMLLTYVSYATDVCGGCDYRALPDTSCVANVYGVFGSSRTCTCAPTSSRGELMLPYLPMRVLRDVRY